MCVKMTSNQPASRPVSASSSERIAPQSHTLAVAGRVASDNQEGKMAQFYATVRGSRETEVTKTGTKISGMSAHIRGWRIGARIEIRHIDGKDEVVVYQTGGSKGGSTDRQISLFREN
jgi:hypothetical protein